ncbi:MAG: SDR family NAD(P)-dependent oxidoreductase [Gammaproteobacteria bacterium]|nr:MAG: SDR family NAD(P)-dependent oxidoreductase [Gammaproteobacteria bacterium]RLA35529.1 MAG: SDR family NAD(P)-dependent oxidoreductase [Gammaproteobacteria bacterium]
MHFVVNGVGYTGRRVLVALPTGLATGINRSPVAEFDDEQVVTLDLDDIDTAVLRLPDRYTLLYTVPPASDSLDDPRLVHFLSMLDPPPKRFVYISTSGVYGDCAGRLVNETDTLTPVTDRARRRFAAEEMLQRWCSKKECELFVLRAPAIYGPGRLGIDKIRTGKAVLREAESNPGNRIHVDDLAACCIAAMTGNKAPGIYNVADGDFRSPTWFANTVADLAGLDPPPTITRAQAKETLSAARLSFLSESRKLDTTKMRETLEFSPNYTNPEDGIRASLVEDGLLRKKTQ